MVSTLIQNQIYSSYVNIEHYRESTLWKSAVFTISEYKQFA